MVSRAARRARKGLGTTEWVVVAAAIALVVIGSIATLGNRVNGELGTTAEDVADPTRLTQRFGDGQ